MTTEPGLELDRVVVGRVDRPMLPSTSLTVPRGSSLAVLGDAGSGKSTVLAVLAGRRAPQQGAVRLDGAALDTARVGFAEQQHALPEGMTAAEHLLVPLLARGGRPRSWSEAEQVLEALGLPPAAHHNLLEELSGGQQQRVALARALVGEPSLLCLDDPVSELDGASAELVWEVLAATAARGAVVVVATPDPQDAERLDRVVRLGP